MKKFLFISILLICFCQNKSNAQQKSQADNVHEYYVMIHGAITMDDVNFLEKLISGKDGVTSFLHKGFPVKYFILRSTRAIPMTEMEAWVYTRSYKLQYLIEDQKTKDKLDGIRRKDN